MRLGISLAWCWIALSAALGAGQASAPAEGPALLAIPETGAQAKSREMIRGVFKEDFARTTPAVRQALAKRLVSEAAGTKDDPIARYVLLIDGCEIAAATGDAETACRAIGELAKLYKVDAIDLQRAALLRANTAATTPDAAESVLKFCLETADAAALVDAFDVVGQMVNVAEAAANKTRKVTVVSGIQARLGDFRALSAEFTQVKVAYDVLAKKPDDAAAHTLIGRFYALHKGQWEMGLPHLAKGGDPELRGLAEKELASPVDGLDHTALGDAWWEFAEKSNGLTRTHAHKHAVMWYQRSQQSLSGITKTRIETRLREGITTPSAKTTTSTSAALPGAVPAVAASTGSGVNLLAMIDPAKDAAEGKWTVEGGGLTVASGRNSVLQLPYQVPDEFDLRISFTRVEGEGSINVLLAAHKKAFGFALDVKGEARFERVANKINKDNPTTVPVVLSNGKRYTVTVQIRRDAIRALLDDKLLTQWKTDYKDLTRYTVWKMPDEKLCGLGANGAKVMFHSVEVVEVTGAGKPLR